MGARVTKTELLGYELRKEGVLLTFVTHNGSLVSSPHSTEGGPFAAVEWEYHLKHGSILGSMIYEMGQRQSNAEVSLAKKEKDLSKLQETDWKKRVHGEFGGVGNNLARMDKFLDSELAKTLTPGEVQTLKEHCANVIKMGKALENKLNK